MKHRFNPGDLVTIDQFSMIVIYDGDPRPAMNKVFPAQVGKMHIGDVACIISVDDELAIIIVDGIVGTILVSQVRHA